MYLGGLLSQLYSNYDAWIHNTDFQTDTKKLNAGLPECLRLALTGRGVYCMLLIAAAEAGIYIYFKVYKGSVQRNLMNAASGRAVPGFTALPHG